MQYIGQVTVLGLAVVFLGYCFLDSFRKQPSTVRNDFSCALGHFSAK